MEDYSNKSPAELLEIVDETKDKEILRQIANEMNIKFSGNTGVTTLKEKLIPELEAKANPEPEADKDDPVIQALTKKSSKEAPKKAKSKKTERKSILELSRTAQALLDPHAKGLTEIEIRAIVRAKAMRLHRVRVHNLDPDDAALTGAIKTVYNKYTGKITKYIPFGDENEVGYHIPEILLTMLKNEKYTMRKEIKQRGQVSSFAVKQYRTVLVPKFNIEILPKLTKDEIAGLAQDQKARGAIDQNN